MDTRMIEEHASGLWEERWHPLREEWVIIAAHRQERPWIGAITDMENKPLPAFMPDCYLCPGNIRSSGARNPFYTGTYVFDNDHPCVGLDAPAELEKALPPYRNRRAAGIARVICYSPRHNLTLAEMSQSEISNVIQVWRQQTRDLGRHPEVEHVLIFENKGEVVGVSNPHPHGQIYAANFVFKTIETEWEALKRYLKQTGKNLFGEIIVAEKKDGRRILFEDEHTIVFVPYFARYAYEVYVAPKRRVSFCYQLKDKEVDSLAAALKDITVRFDNLWNMSFPYVMPLHQAPANSEDDPFFHFYIVFHPPLRRPNLIKYLAGPEIGGGNFLSDTSPEEKAAELRGVSSRHFRDKSGIT
ncbi:MAG: galactose-1-phosphate uridylyltransferase [Candidatus Aminicenantes bacterium]|nr:galactose-1-phosphate uridylyltransferase [Candidatus Aminicenantes bacterium]